MARGDGCERGVTGSVTEVCVGEGGRRKEGGGERGGTVTSNGWGGGGGGGERERVGGSIKTEY